MKKLHSGFKSKKKRIAIKSFLVLGAFLLVLSVFGIVQGQSIKKQAVAYEEEIQSIEIPEFGLTVDEEGKYDKKVLVTHKQALALASEELELLKDKITSLPTITIFGSNDEKGVLLKSLSEKLDEVEKSFDSVDVFLEQAKENADAHAKAVHERQLAAKAREEAKKEAIKKESEQNRLNTEKEAEKKDSVVSSTTTKTPNKSTSVSSGSKTGTKTTSVPTKTQPKTTTTTKTEPVKEPQPEYGSISRKNENVSEYWQWEHGEFYYIWNGSSWNTYIRPGSTVTDRDRWVSHLQKAFPQPTREGTSVSEKVGAGTIWVYFGGKF